jgi:carotenoid cleavage dioxygenase-like enzyme
MSAAQPVETAAQPSGRARGFYSGAREVDDAAVATTGDLPRWLRGTLLLNGPALWELPGGRLEHWFDGYAMWHALRIGDDGVRYRSRFARSQAYRRSLERGAPAYGEFGTANPAGLFERLRAPQATDNPAVVMSRHGHRWVSVTETPYLTYFDPQTLETQERLAIGQGSGETMHLMAAHGFTLDDGSYLNVGTELGPRCTRKLLRLRPQATQPEVLARLRLPKPGYLHAFALAPGHAVLWDTALRVQPLPFRFSARSYADNHRWEPEGGSAVHAMSLADGTVRSWRVPPMMAFHATQAFADGADLVLDLAAYADANVVDDLRLDERRAAKPLRTPVRHLRYRLKNGAAEAESEALPGDIELQQVHPGLIGRGRARYCWGAGNGDAGEFLDRTVKVDLETGEKTTWRRSSATQLEPLYVPRPGSSAEDDGVLLVPTLADGDSATVIAVLDARTMSCLAELCPPQTVPFGFHAAFRPA